MEEYFSRLFAPYKTAASRHADIACIARIKALLIVVFVRHNVLALVCADGDWAVVFSALAFV